MSDGALQRTVRRCTACLLVVLGAISIEVATIEYPDGGVLVGGSAIVAGAVYLLGSAVAGLASHGESGSSGGGGDDASGRDGSDGDTDREESTRIPTPHPTDQIG